MPQVLAVAASAAGNFRYALLPLSASAGVAATVAALRKYSFR
ncbi:hypothetical protein [Rothia sp. (in: high G+C Gram-positive bacteria)]